MPREIYNEGRVVGYSAYELFVKNYLAEGGDPTKVPTEREWLASSLAMGSSMIVKVSGASSGEPNGHIDIPLPTNTKLQAANVIIGSFFDGDAEFEGAWATKVTDYGTGITNTSQSHPSGTYPQSYFWQLPYSTYSNEDTTYVSLRTKRLQNYLRITDGVILMPGNYVYTSGNTPPSDLKPNLNSSPILRLRVESDTDIESFATNTEPRILLTGFTLGSVLLGLVGLDGSTDTSTNVPQDGGFNGPAIFPWASKVILTVPNSYLRKSEIAYRVVGDEFENPYKVSKNASFIDIDSDLNTIYGSTSGSVYSPYTYTTPARSAGIDAVYDYYATPTPETSTFMIHQVDANYPPALYANVLGRIDSYSSENLYPVDIVAPGSIKMFKNGDNTMMKSYESTFVGTTALNLSASGILSMSGQSGLYSLNNIIAGTGASVTRDSSGAWVVSADATGQINVVTDSNTSSIKIIPSTSSGVKTFTVSQTIQKKPQTTGIDVTSSNGVVNLENTMKLKPGVGIDIARNGDEYTITNSRPVLSSSDYTDTPYTGYRVWYPLRAKQLLDPNNTYQPINGYYTGVVRRIDYSGYSWKDYILSGPDSNNPPTTYGDTAHREKLGMSYTVNMSNDVPISGVLQVSESVSVDAGEMTVVPGTYSSTITYNTLDYCSYTDAKSHVRKFRCIRDNTLDQSPLLNNGNVNAGYWREVTAVVTAYNSSKTYYKGDYVIINNGQYVCISDTPVTGAWQSSDWELDNATVLPSITYGLCIADAISSGLGSSEIPAGSSLFYTHGRSYNEKGTNTIDGVTYTYYRWDHGIIARFGITPAMCKKMFFGDEDYTFQGSSRVLIDAPTSGSSDNIINWRAYVGNSSSSASNSDKMRLSYATGYRLLCRYPFIVDNGNIKMATFDNISAVNGGWLRENFGSAVGYDLTRDTQGGVLSTTNDPYRNFAMIFDLIVETISDGFNNQLMDPITYEGHPTAPYLIASDNAHMSVPINLRMNNVSI